MTDESDDEYIFVNLIYPRTIVSITTAGNDYDEDDHTEKYKL